MYLTSLRLHHVRLFERLDLSFRREGEAPRMFTVVLAENGHAKTTLLQAIALAAAGVIGANNLAPNAASFFDKRWKPKADDPSDETGTCFSSANFTFADAPRQREYPGFTVHPPRTPSLTSLVHTSVGWKSFQGASDLHIPDTRQFADRALHHTQGVLPPLDVARARDLPLWFVAGYGTSRALPLPNATLEPGNRSIDRLQSLFRPTPLIATGFVDVLARQFGPEVAGEYARALRDVLLGSDTLPGLLPKDGPIRVAELELRGQGGIRGSGDLIEAERIVLGFADGEAVKVPAVWLSAGYQSTIAWVADLIGQVALDAGKVVAPEKMEGLVLLDEIDQHLHPRWQSTLVPALKQTFPRIQFVATTHSPMILPGLAPGEVVVLQPDARGSITASVPEEDPRLLTAAQLYREFFGMPDLFPSKVGERLRRYGLLAGVSARNDVEEAEVQRLYQELLADGVEVWEPEPREKSA